MKKWSNAEKMTCGCEIAKIGKYEAKDYPEATEFVIDKFCEKHQPPMCVICNYETGEPTEINNEGLCRNCESAKLEMSKETI